MKEILLLLVAALALGLSKDSSGLEVPLKYEKAPVVSNTFFPYGYNYLQTTQNLPRGDWKLPPLTTDRPLYVLLRLGDSVHLLVTDKSKTGDKFYSRLWFDSNGDGDLTDEKPVSGLPGERNNLFTTQFPAINFMIKLEDKRLPYCLKPSLNGRMVSESSFQSGTGASFSYTVQCAYSGSFTVNGRQYRIQVGDSNGNGRFSDYSTIADVQNPFGRSRIYPKGDNLYITDGSKMNFNDRMPLGDLLFLNETLFYMKLDIPNGRMILTEINKGLSPLKLTLKPERFTLFIEDKGHCVNMYKPSGNVTMLPAGKYRLLEYQVVCKDEKGALWRLKALGTNETPSATLAQNSEAVLQLENRICRWSTCQEKTALHLPDGHQGISL